MTDEQIAEKQRKAGENQKIKDERERESYKYVMADKRGREFVFNLLKACNVFQAQFDTNHAIMSFKEGKRNVGLEIIARSNKHTPNSYIKLLKENKPHQKNEENKNLKKGESKNG